MEDDSQVDQTLRLWTGHGTTTINGDSYTGVGDLGQISAISEVAEVASKGITLQITGVSLTMISVALSMHYQGRPCTVYRVFVDEAEVLIADPVQVFGGRMDTMNWQDSGDVLTITVKAESILVDLEIPRIERYTLADQQRKFPADKGFEFVEVLQEAQIDWPSGKNNKGERGGRGRTVQVGASRLLHICRGLR